MKKAIETVLIILICLTILSSCSGSDIGGTIDSLLDKVDSKIDSLSSGDTPGLKDKPTTFSSDTQETEAEKNVSTEPIAVFENGSVILYVNSASMESWGYVLDITAKNNSPHTLSFSADSGMLNSLVLTPSMSFETEASGETNGQVVWYSSQIEDYQIGSVSSAQFHFTAISTDTDETVYADNSVIAYPEGKGAARRYSLPEKSGYSEQFVKENDYGTFSVYFSPEGINDANGYTLNVFLDNNSEYDAVFEITSAKINGKDSNPYWTRTLPSGAMTYSSVCWYGNPFENDGIDPGEISQIDFGISIRNANGNSALAEGEFTLKTEE